MKNLRLKYYNEFNPQKTYNEWVTDIFVSPIGNSLRLNYYGFLQFKKKYKYYIVNSPSNKDNPRKSKHILFLTNYCKFPYYIGNNNIMFFDKEEALVFRLCDGDIDNVQKVI